MRRPATAGTQKRNRTRLRLKRGPGKQIRRTQRDISPEVRAARPEAAANSQQSSARREAATIATPEAGVHERTRCGFGAVRVGALLARLRLHLQTDRFLAVHRGDTMWETGCMAAALALADVVAGMQQAELDTLLAPQGTQEQGALAILARCGADLGRGPR